MAALYPIYLGTAAALGYAYKTGRLSDFIDTLTSDNNSKSNPSKSSHSNHAEPRQRPTIIVQPNLNNNNRTSYFLPLGCACFIGLGGYYYYIHHNGTKKVIGAVEETAEETQVLVQQTDDNNSKRFEILDTKNEERAQNLEVEIRSEQRAGFNVISEQLYCLQQVAIQTLSAVASLSSNNNREHIDNNNNNNNINNNEKLLAYCDKAQEMADTILSDEYMLKTKENNLNDIKAEIQLRNNNVMMTGSGHNKSTPGGPDDDIQQQQAQGNIFDMNQMQNITVITNGYRDINTNEYEEEEENGNIVSRMIERVQNGMKMGEMGYFVWNNKEYVMLSGGVMAALYVGNKAVNYLSTSSSSSHSVGVSYKVHNNNNNNNNVNV